VRNLGNVAVGSIVVTDDNGTPTNTLDDFAPTFVGGDSDGDGLLDVNEVWQYTASATALDLHDPNSPTVLGRSQTPQDATPIFENKAVVVGFSNSGVQVMEEDLSHYCNPQLAALGDRVWIDTNQNGVQDPGEVGMSGVVVNLFGPGSDGAAGTPDDQFLRSETTDGQGNYLFEDLNPSLQYTVQFILPTAHVFTLANQPDDATDSDADPNTGRTGPITLQPGATHRTVDAGVFSPSVVIEKHTNGVDADDPFDPAIPMFFPEVPLISSGDLVTWTYFVSNPGNVALSNVLVTDDNGTPNNPFDNFSPTFVRGDTDNDGLLDLNEVWQYTASAAAVDLYAANATTVPGQDQGNPRKTYENIAVVVGTAGSVNVTDDDPSHYGNLVRLGDRVWEDRNSNGFQNGNEPGINGATVRLVGTSRVTTTTNHPVTGEPGFYEFIVPAGGNYQVEFDVSTITVNNQGLTTADAAAPIGSVGTFDDGTDSDARTSPGNTRVGTTLLRQVITPDLTIDAGVVPQAALVGNFVWFDDGAGNPSLARNGIQDAGEAGVAGVAVQLLRELPGGSLQVLQSATTDASGFYQFSVFPPDVPGNLRIQFTIPAALQATGYNFTQQNVGSDLLDSDVDSTGLTELFTLPDGVTDLTWDAGLTQRCTGTKRCFLVSQF
jgi:hypothetical protein